MAESSVLVRQLAALQEERPTARIVAFVPRPQLGMALRAATTRHHKHVAGLTTMTVEQYAETCVGHLLRAGEPALQPLDVGPQLFLTASALREVDVDTREALTGTRSVSGVLRPLSRTFDTLRLHDLSPSEYEEALATGSDRQRAQADVYAAYAALLAKHDFYDTAHLLNTATEHVRTDAFDPSSTVFAVLDTVQLLATSKAFLDALRAEGTSFFRLGTAPSEKASPPAASPPDRAATQFSDCPDPPNVSPTPSPVGRIALDPSSDLTASEAQQLQFWTTTGARREVQAVFEDIVANEHPLDTVEIAFTSQEPYLAYIDSFSERYAVPTSLSTGRAIGATRPGQALQGFFDWIAEGFPVDTLIRLLRGGLLQLEEPLGPEGTRGTLESRRAAALLAERRYGAPPDGYVGTLDAWIEELDAERDNLQAASSEAPWLTEKIQRLDEKKAAVEALRNSITTLLDFAQVQHRSSVPPSALAEGAQELLKVFGPTPKPTDPEAERTPDEAARNHLLDRLQTLAQSEGLPSSPLRSLASQLSTWIELSPFVRAQRPQPGRAHVVPLQSAGYADRDHLYVVGLDASSAATEQLDDPMLTDEERKDLSSSGASLPLRSNQADTDAWLTARALARHEGTVTLSASTHDVVEDEALFEAPLYLQLRDAALDAREETEDTSSLRTHHPLSVSADRALTALDRWTDRAPPAPSAVDDALQSKYPWIHSGLTAEQARASGRYTVYDGLLEPGSYPGLNPLAHSTPVSAGQLEAYARAPFAYFLRYVLGVEPPDEPALDDVAWLDARDRGAVLHETFKQFMSELGRRPTLEDESTLHTIFSRVLSEQGEHFPPPSEVVFAATERQLWNDARLFLRAETSRTDDHSPEAFELGFGTPLHRRSDGDLTTLPTLEFDTLSFSLRGRIDRVDRHPDDRVSLWDYKTGSSREFAEDDLLDEGRHLQWALYAYAYRALTGDSVRQAGYFFTSTDEMGRRIAGDPDLVRSEVGRLLHQIGDCIAAGVFPLNDGNDLKYSFDALFQDFRERQSDLRSKAWPDDRPLPPPLAEE